MRVYYLNNDCNDNILEKLSYRATDFPCAELYILHFESDKTYKIKLTIYTYDYGSYSR